mgnify:CR=1 FL=1
MFRGQLTINSCDIHYIAPGVISQSVVDIVILYGKCDQPQEECHQKYPSQSDYENPDEILQKSHAPRHLQNVIIRIAAATTTILI